MIKITSAQYQIEALPDWKSYVSKVENLVAQAKKEGAHGLKGMTAIHVNFISHQ
jgi:hypothetical protein